MFLQATGEFAKVTGNRDGGLARPGGALVVDPIEHAPLIVLQRFLHAVHEPGLFMEPGCFHLPDEDDWWHGS